MAWDWILTLLLSLWTLHHLFRPQCKYYFKFLYLYASFCVVGLLLLPLGLLFIRNPYYVSQIGARMMKHVKFVLGIEYLIEGVENIADNVPMVVIANHQSSIDVISMLEIWPILKRCRPIAKGDLLRTGPFGWAISLCGVVFISRADKSSGKTDMNRAGEEAKRTQTSLFIYAEGTRNAGTELLLPFKKGAFHVAINSELPVLPVVIGRYNFIDPISKRFDSGRIRIAILEPIPTAGMIKDIHMEGLIQETRDKMLKTLREDELNY